MPAVDPGFHLLDRDRMDVLLAGLRNDELGLAGVDDTVPGVARCPADGLSHADAGIAPAAGTAG
ncbi:MAG: hypothetical protein WEF51_03135 [Chloroflexota bacterium]